jgi:hypothetical protein
LPSRTFIIRANMARAAALIRPIARVRVGMFSGILKIHTTTVFWYQ